MRTVIVGGGKLGQQVADLLVEEGHGVCVIDQDPQVLEALQKKPRVTTVEGHGGSASALVKAGVREAEVMIALTDNDETNIIAALTSKELGGPRTIVRIRNEVYLRERKTTYQRLLGLDLILSLEHLAAEQLAMLVENPGTVAMETFADGLLTMKQLPVDERCPILNTPFRKIGFSEIALVAGIVRRGEFLFPDGNSHLEAGDSVILVGEKWLFPDLEELFHPPTEEVRKVTVFGTTMMTRQLTSILLAGGIKPVILSDDPRGCALFERSFRKVEVHQVATSDKQRFHAQGFRKAELFIAGSDSDEQNFLVSVMAREAGVERVLAVIHDPEHARLADHEGLEAPVCARTLLANSILSFMRESPFVSSVVLQQGQMEIAETVAQPDSKLVNRPLRQVGFPKGVLVCAVVREEGVLIPQGRDVIRPGDIVILAMLRDRSSEVRRIVSSWSPDSEEGS